MNWYFYIVSLLVLIGYIIFFDRNVLRALKATFKIAFESLDNPNGVDGHLQARLLLLFAAAIFIASPIIDVILVTRSFLYFLGGKKTPSLITESRLKKIESNASTNTTKKGIFQKE